MKAAQITTSAALFYSRETEDDAVPFAWFERVVALFDEFRLSPILFTAGGGPFELDDCYRLADGAGEEYRWGDPAPIYPRRSALIDALRKGQIYAIALDSPRADSKDRSEWHAKLSVSSTFGRTYIGIDHQFVADPARLLRRACAMARGLFDIRYGFAYSMPLADGPDLYATGSRSLSLSELQEWLRRRHEGSVPALDADDWWKYELKEGCRHLAGMFRDVYSANVLSAAHVDAAGLRSAPVGRLSEVDDELWLWEVSEDEMPIAKTMLRAKRLVIGCEL